MPTCRTLPSRRPGPGSRTLARAASRPSGSSLSTPWPRNSSSGWWTPPPRCRLATRSTPRPAWGRWPGPIFATAWNGRSRSHRPWALASCWAATAWTAAAGSSPRRSWRASPPTCRCSGRSPSAPWRPSSGPRTRRRPSTWPTTQPTDWEPVSGRRTPNVASGWDGGCSPARCSSTAASPPTHACRSGGSSAAATAANWPRSASTSSPTSGRSGCRRPARPRRRPSPSDHLERAMTERPFEFLTTAEGPVLRVQARGFSVLGTPMLNRGTAFTPQERRALGLVGLLPHGVSTIDGQVRRTYAQYGRQPDELARNVYLANLRDRNEILFYRLLSEHLGDMLPIVYTPTVGKAIERYSHEYRRPRGVFLSVDHPDLVEESFRNYGLGPDDVDLIVATDAEGILGIGDWGVGGIEIAIGKLAVYIAAAGLHPRRVIPVVLDMGTDNLALLNDPMYLGARHARVRGQRYDDFIDTYVQTATKLFPHALLHWEDFAAANARRILERYAGQCCTFNDDMQGTAAVVLAAAFAALRASGSRMADQRVVIHGAGTAGVGIADMLREVMVADGLDPEEATRRFWCLGRQGLLTDDQADRLLDFQRPYARPAAEVAGWTRTGTGEGPSLADVVGHV